MIETSNLIQKAIIIAISLMIISLNSHSQIIEKENSWDFFNLKGKIKSIRQLEYEYSNGQLSKSRLNHEGGNLLVSFSENLILDNSLVKFSNSGLVTEWIEFNEYNVPSDTILVKYKNNLKIPISISLFKYNHIIFAISYDYDEKNRIVKANYKDSEYDMYVRYSYKDNYHNIIDTFFNDNDTVVFNFKKLNNNTYLTNLSKGSIRNTDNLMINNQFDVIKMTYKTMEYSYDDNGNWIEKKELFENNVQRVCRRKIEYY